MRPPQVVEAYLIVLIRGDLTNVFSGKPASTAAFPNGVMGLVRGVDRPGQEVIGKAFPPRGDHRGEVRQGPAAGEDATRAGWIADDLAEPSNDVQLELRESRCGNPHPHVSIHGVRDEVGDRGREDATPGDIRQITRCSRIVRERDRFPEEEVQQPVEVCASLREGLGERGRPGVRTGLVFRVGGRLTR